MKIYAQAYDSSVGAGSQKSHRCGMTILAELRTYQDKLATLAPVVQSIQAKASDTGWSAQARTVAAVDAGFEPPREVVALIRTGVAEESGKNA